jgi:hypothetical protein
MMRAVLKQDVARRQPRTSWLVAAICNVKGALIEAAFPGSTCTNISPSQAQATPILAGIVASHPPRRIAERRVHADPTARTWFLAVGEDGYFTPRI